MAEVLKNKSIWKLSNSFLWVFSIWLTEQSNRNFFQAVLKCHVNWFGIAFEDLTNSVNNFMIKGWAIKQSVKLATTFFCILLFLANESFRKKDADELTQRTLFLFKLVKRDNFKTKYLQCSICCHAPHYLLRRRYTSKKNWQRVYSMFNNVGIYLVSFYPTSQTFI